MTNAEKFEEIFGLEPDTTQCPIEDCSKCPLYDEEYYCTETWWESEYKERGITHEDKQP